MLDTEFQEFKQGDLILEEGSFGSEVLLLVEGTADIKTANVIVGRLGENSIFGVKSALTGAKRNASVYCSSPRCFVAKITKEQFSQLIRNQPEIAEKLIVDLVQIIEEQNSKLCSPKP